MTHDPIKYMQLPAEARQIIHRVAKDEGVRVLDIMSEKRGHLRVSEARHKAMYLIRKIPADDGRSKFSYPEMGEMFDRHYTSIIHAVKKEDAKSRRSKPARAVRDNLRRA